MNNMFEKGSIFYISYHNGNDFDFVEIIDNLNDQDIKVRVVMAKPVESKIAKVSYLPKATYEKFQIFPGQYITEEVSLKRGEYANKPLVGEFEDSYIISSAKVEKDYAWINEEDPTKDYFRASIQDEIDEAEEISNSFFIEPKDLYKILLVTVNADYTECPYEFIKIRNLNSNDVGIFTVLKKNIEKSSDSNDIRGWHSRLVTPLEETESIIQIPYIHSELKIERINDRLVDNIKVWDGNPVSYSWDTSD